MRDNKLIQFYLTNLCNSKCKTCGIWKDKHKIDCIDMLDLQRVKDIILGFTYADFVFGGGEPTLYSDIDELLYFSNMYNINYTLLTNCVSFDRINNVLDKHKVKNLTISCDGRNHDKIRGVPGNLRNIIMILSLYRDKIPNIKLSYTYSKYNQYTIDKDMEFFKSLGFDKVYFCLAQDMDLLSADNEVVADSVIPILDHIDMLYDKDADFIIRLLEDDVKRCDSIGNVHTIYSNGDVVLCQSYKSSKVIGNINKNNFKDLLDDIPTNYICKYDYYCNLLCQRRYD